MKLKSDLPFLGRAAVEKSANAPLTKRLMTFTVADPKILLSGRETIYRDGKRVGYLASGGWGYTVGRQHRHGLRPQSPTASPTIS